MAIKSYTLFEESREGGSALVQVKYDDADLQIQSLHLEATGNATTWGKASWPNWDAENMLADFSCNDSTSPADQSIPAGFFMGRDQNGNVTEDPEPEAFQPATMLMGGGVIWG